MNERADTSRLLIALADQLPNARGLLHRAARLVLEPDDGRPVVRRADACGQCGRPIARQSRGRPRKWCSDKCRRAAHR